MAWRRDLAVVEARDVDPREPWPDGRDRAQDQALPTDLTDEEWQHIWPLLPSAPRRGRKPKTDPREVLNVIRYMARSGGGWRMLPKDFPPSQSDPPEGCQHS